MAARLLRLLKMADQAICITTKNQYLQANFFKTLMAPGK